MIIQLTDSEAEQMVEEGHGVIFMFFANWCGSCRLVKHKFEKISNRAPYAGIRFVMLNAEECPKMRKKSQVNALPFFASYNNGIIESSGPTVREEQICKMAGQLVEAGV